ncbi:MAG TPA: hypothetical protein VIH35_05700, partial [Kiritimatiellia bacterium]
MRITYCMNTRAKTWYCGIILLALGSLVSAADTNSPTSGSGTNRVANTNVAAMVRDGLPYLIVEEAGLWIPVDDLELTFGVGRQLLLFQQNSDYFIAIATFEDGSAKLCAFPRVHARDQGTAWVTN